MGENNSTRDPGTLRSMRFSTEVFRPQDRFDATNEFTRGLYYFHRFDNGVETPRHWAPSYSGETWSLGKVSATAFKNEPSIVDGLAGNSVRDDAITLRIYDKGKVQALGEDAGVFLAPGQIHLMRGDHRLHTHEAVSALSLRFSYDIVGYNPHIHPRVLSVAMDSWLGRSLETAMRSVFDDLPTMTSTTARHAEAALVGLTRSLLSTNTLDDETRAVVNDARAVAMKKYVVDHLSDPDLNAQQLQSVFNASRATVFRAFEDVGGVGRFAREQRLNAIHRELGNAAPRYGAISRIAEKFGYWDQVAFNKAFRSFHGVRPGDVIGTSQMQTTPDPIPPQSSSLLGGPGLASFWSANEKLENNPLRW